MMVMLSKVSMSLLVSHSITRPITFYCTAALVSALALISEDYTISGGHR